MIYPSLNLDARLYLNDGNGKPGLASLNRASNASYVNAIGRIATAAPGALRHDYNPVTGGYLGWLLEEQRTNLLLYSNDFGNAVWNKNSSIIETNVYDAVDGTNTADKLVGGNGSGLHHVYQTCTFADTVYCFSLFAKAIEKSWVALEGTAGEYSYFNLATGQVGSVSNATARIHDYGNGWYRCSITFTAIAGSRTCRIYVATADSTANYVGDGSSGVLLWGAQLEAGAFPTSFIPTASSTATRMADQFTIATSGFPYNSREGTLLVSGDVTALRQQSMVCIGDSTDNAIGLRMQGADGQIRAFVRSSGAETANIGATSAGIDAAFTAALAYRANDFAMVTNGGSVVTDTSGTLPAAAGSLRIGALADATQPLCGHVRHLAYFPRRLSNTDLQDISL